MPAPLVVPEVILAKYVVLATDPFVIAPKITVLLLAPLDASPVTYFAITIPFDGGVLSIDQLAGVVGQVDAFE